MEDLIFGRNWLLGSVNFQEEKTLVKGKNKGGLALMVKQHYFNRFSLVPKKGLFGQDQGNLGLLAPKGPNWPKNFFKLGLFHNLKVSFVGEIWAWVTYY